MSTIVNWRRVEEIYALALERPTPTRKQFVDDACAGEPSALRDRVEELLELGHEEPLLVQLEQFFGSTAQAIEEELTPKEGTRLLDRYVIRSKIGEGGMGVVYAAEDHKFEPPAKRAVKMIRLEIVADPEALRRFKQEANVMARLTHERFVRIYDVGVWKQQLFLVMELIEGESLQERGQRTWSPKEAARLIASLAAAMSHVHALKIFHLDLKPGNILLTSSREPKIADFGIAKLQGEAREAGKVMGSRANMAPEQWEGDNAKIGFPSDVYALGTILYELLTGTPPYAPEGKSSEELKRLVTDPDILPDRPGLKHWSERSLELICLKCLEKKPDRRYTAGELAADLERWCHDQPPRRVRVSWPDRLRLWCRRNPAGVALPAFAFALLALLGWRVAEALQEPARAQQALARSQAKTIHRRLKQFQGAVEKTVWDRQLGELLSREEPDHKGLQEFIARTGEKRVDLSGESPFESWFILDRNGKMVARWVTKDPRLGIDPLPKPEHLIMRDYSQGARKLAEEKGGSPVYVSKVYQSILSPDMNYKFGVSAVVRHEDRIVGVLVATVTTGPDMGLPDFKDGDLVTALLAEEDPFIRAGEQRPGASASQYLVLLHPAFQHGDRPVWFPKTRLHELEAGVTADYRDPVAEVNEAYGGRWLAAFAPVEGSNFIVVVQRPHRPILPDGAWLALGLVIVTGVLLVAVMNRLRRRQSAKEPAAPGEQITVSWNATGSRST